MSQWIVPSAASVLASVTLQLAYDNSGAPPHIVVDAVNLGVTIRDNAVPIGSPLFQVQSNTPTNLFDVSTTVSNFRVDVDHNQFSINNPDEIFNASSFDLRASATASFVTARIQDRAIELLPNDMTFGVAKPFVAMIQWDSTITFTFASATLGQIIGALGLVEYESTGAALNAGLLFNNGATFRKTTASGILGSFFTFIGQGRYEIDTGLSTTIFVMRDFLSQPVFQRTGGAGTGTMLVGTLTNFSAGPGAVNTGVTVTTRRGLQVLDPAGAGVITTQIGVDIENMTMAGTNIALRLVQSAGTSIQSLGVAVSTFAGDIHINDGISLVLGTVGGNRVELLRSAAGVMRMIGVGGVNNEGLDWDFDPATADTIAVTSSTGAGLGFNLAAFAIGTTVADPTSNWQFLLAPGAKTISLAGDFARALFSSTANVTVDAAMTTLFTWTLNEPGITIGTGSVVDAGVLLVQTAPSAGTNRYGVLITSNPSGGTLNYALRVTAGDTRLDGDLELTGTNLGFYGSTPAPQPTVTGSRAGNAALADLLTELDTLGLIVDSSSA